MTLSLKATAVTAGQTCAHLGVPPTHSMPHIIPCYNRYDLEGPVRDVFWPERLVRLSFGDKFDDTLEALRWAPRLESLWLGQKFNHAIEGVDFPQNLRQLRFGHAFNQPIERVRWPRGLQVR